MVAKRVAASGRSEARRSLRHPDIAPVHPGALLREMVLPALGLTVTEAAARLGMTRQGLHRLLAGTLAVTPATALRDRKSTRLNSSHNPASRMPSSA
jgi:addiction module HigA family antidote